MEKQYLELEHPNSRVFLTCNCCNAKNEMEAIYCANCGQLLPNRDKPILISEKSYNEMIRDKRKLDEFQHTNYSGINDKYVCNPSFYTGISVLHKSVLGKIFLYVYGLIVTTLIIASCYFYNNWDFYSELTPFHGNKGCGFINKQGKVIIKEQYNVAFPFDDKGIAMVQNWNKKWGRINKRGEVVTPFIYDDLYWNYSGWCRAKKDGKWGFISASIPDKIIPVVFKDCWVFNGFLALVQYSDESYGYYNIDGEPISSEKFKSAMNYSCNGLFRIQFKDEKYNFIKSDGSLLNENRYLSAFDFREGYAVILNADYSWDYIDTNGVQVSHFKAQELASFCQSYAAVMFNGKWAVINDKFELVSECKYDKWKNDDGTYKVIAMENEKFPVSLNDQNGYLNTKGIFTPEK